MGAVNTYYIIYRDADGLLLHGYFTPVYLRCETHEMHTIVHVSGSRMRVPAKYEENESYTCSKARYEHITNIDNEITPAEIEDYFASYQDPMNDINIKKELQL